MGPRSSGTSTPPTPQGSSATGIPPRAPTPPRSATPRPRVQAPAPSPASAGPRAMLSEATARREHSDRDMRSKRPPALSFLLRMDTGRRALRVASLLLLDFVGVALAIFTALALKEAVLGNLDVRSVYNETRHFLPFAYLLTALLFARSGLYSARSQRPGLSRIVGSLFQVAFVALIFAVVSGEHFSSFYIFYGSLIFALVYVSTFSGGVRVDDRRAAARCGLPAPGDGGRHRQAHPRRRSRARRSRTATRCSKWSGSCHSIPFRPTDCATWARSRRSTRCSSLSGSTR